MSTPVIASVVVHVSDMDRALHFYRDGLGLGVRFDSGAQSDPTMLALTGTPPEASMRIVVLDLHGSAGLTLSSIEHKSPQAAPGEPARPYESSGSVHVGLRVVDLDAVLRRACTSGGTPFGTPGVVGPPGRRATLAFLRDPDGSVIELVQKPPTTEHPDALTDLEIDS